MKNTTRIAALAFAAFATITALKAENNAATQEDAALAKNGKKDYSTTAAAKKVVVPAETTTPQFQLNVSENYDSRYMFRGVNVIPNTGILSTTFNPIWNITANDKISVPLWYATAVGKTQSGPAFNGVGGYMSPGYGMQNYRELDVPINYTHAIGNWTLGVGYQLYAYFNDGPGNNGSATGAGGYLNANGPAQQGIQNEINENVAYTFKTKYATITPSLTYYQELGTPNNYSYGSINAGSSFLSPSINATIPLTFLKQDGSITFNPNTQLNYSFRYNNSYNPDFTGTGMNPHPYTGFNNWQFQLPVTWQITKIWSVTGYWAYSYQNANLVGTAPSTGWAGCSIGASF
jgi:hypothetical protein